MNRFGMQINQANVSMRQLRAFSALAELRNFTRAAEELGISVKTVEGHITKGLSILRKALQDHGLLSLIQILLLFV